MKNEKKMPLAFQFHIVKTNGFFSVYVSAGDGLKSKKSTQV